MEEESDNEDKEDEISDETSSNLPNMGPSDLNRRYLATLMQTMERNHVINRLSRLLHHRPIICSLIGTLVGVCFLPFVIFLMVIGGSLGFGFLVFLFVEGGLFTMATACLFFSLSIPLLFAFFVTTSSYIFYHIVGKLRQGLRTAIRVPRDCCTRCVQSVHEFAVEAHRYRDAHPRYFHGDWIFDWINDHFPLIARLPVFELLRERFQMIQTQDESSTQSSIAPREALTEQSRDNFAQGTIGGNATSERTREHKTRKGKRHSSRARRHENIAIEEYPVATTSADVDDSSTDRSTNIADSTIDRSAESPENAQMEPEPEVQSPSSFPRRRMRVQRRRDSGSASLDGSNTEFWMTETLREAAERPETEEEELGALEALLLTVAEFFHQLMMFILFLGFCKLFIAYVGYPLYTRYSNI